MDTSTLNAINEIKATKTEKFGVMVNLTQTQTEILKGLAEQHDVYVADLIRLALVKTYGIPSK